MTDTLVLKFAKATVKTASANDSAGVILSRGDKVPEDITPESLQRLKTLDALCTPERLAQIDEALRAGTSIPPEGEWVPTEPLSSEDPSEAAIRALAEQIREGSLTVPQTIELAGDDPERARQVLEADKLVTGGDPRQGVTTALQPIADRATA